MRNTTLCYIEQDGKYLMLHRVKKKDDINHDKWIGVGGKFEALESPEDCLLREVYEETGLTLTQYRYRGIVTFASGQDPQLMHLFTASGFTGTLRACDEGNLEWVDKKALLSLPMWEGDKYFLRLLDQNAPFFSLKLVYDGDCLTQAVLNGKPMDAGAPAQGCAEKEPLLVSACLLGTACRYDGQSRPLDRLASLMDRYHLIPVCPEQLGGLPTPRTPAERRDGAVWTRDGQNVTAAFASGAAEALRLARLFGCRKALLKERSPSCGSGAVYDGTFSGRLIEGDGAAAALLKQHGVLIFGESQVDRLL